ncbi:hypothetical protein NDK37_11135 [Xanthomonas citri pv. glycines]|uniref:hypothetical protein n=1 Tax=Xanthomonas citri TaxID=346 RepID=UPI00271537D6|nr:hypothetical protein [Xanthomonas citri]WLA21971.1 hypothetical protein NDK37_11135 [Xanthomonas citri pv. glycines]
MDVIAFALLVAACLACSLGWVELIRWIADRRDAAILCQLRQDDLIAEAKHQVRIANLKPSLRSAARVEGCVLFDSLSEDESDV